MFPKAVFVSPAQIRGSLGLLRILDVRYSLENPVHYGISEYQKRHVTGASFVDLDKEITGALGPHTSARHPLPECSSFVSWCMQRGIGLAGQPVLCYDDQSGGMGACRMWWMLDAVGVEAYVLDGGIQAYAAEGLPLTESAAPDGKANDPASLTSWPYRTQYERLVSAAEIPLAAKIVDARLAPRFSSTVRPLAMDTVPGHMPGAVSHPWSWNLDESTPGQKRLQPAETLRLRMEGTLGGTSATDAIYTCASGVTACINIAVARHVGLGHPKLYGGAWSEYSGLHRVQLLRQAVETHGLCFTMLTKNLMTNPKATPDNSTLVVDGVAFTSFSEAPELAQQAAVHLFIGEKAVAHFKSGATLEIEVFPKKSQ